MLRKNQKGQSLTEFALILPLLLMLILGIIEGGRIIWAYITVQNAAREAARYAVTGRPFACGGDPLADDLPAAADPANYCDDAATGDPWAPQVLTSTRVIAIKNTAIEYGRFLNVSLWATGDLSDYNANKQTPGAFGVAVIGQDGTNPGGLPNYAGQPGYNVRVEAYYNVEMIDPIYDVIMGGQSIHLEGQVELQNEGTDPNSVGYAGGITYKTDCNPLTDPSCDVGNALTPYITVQDEDNDFSEPQGNNFTVNVNDHQANTAYTLWFVHKDYPTVNHRYSLNFETDNLGTRSLNFIISTSALPTTGSYDYKIYTTLRNNTTPVASCLSDLPTNAPCFEVTAGESTIEVRNIDDSTIEQLQQPVGIDEATWPISSSIPIYLFGHDLNTQYTILFDGLTASAAPGGMLFNGSASNVIPTDGQFGTNLNNIPAYYIATNHSPGDVLVSSEDMSSVEVASTTLKLVAAYMDIAAGERPWHPIDDIVWITLRDHAPLQQYQVIFDDGITPPAIVRANERGELAFNYIVPTGIQEPCAPDPVPGCDVVPMEIYTLDYNRGPNPNKIARRTIDIFTPNEPYINVPGGSRWPAGSPITIQLRQHPAGQYRIYLEQGGTRELINGLTFTIDSNDNQAYNMPYQIPASYGGFYVIRSYAWDGTNETAVASFNIEVTTNPYIDIDNGNRWPPGAEITLRFGNHVPNLPYEIWLDKGGPYEMFLGTISMDAFGGETLDFVIPEDLPTRISPDYYTIQSYFDGELVAETQLEVNPADLRVASIELPPDVTFDIEIPITVTIANDEPVAVSEIYFDADVYIDPSPDPTVSDGGLPPGDYKTWIRNMPANGTVQIYEDVVLFGQENHEIIARADTRDWVVESNEINNILSQMVQAACQFEIADQFSNASLPGWTQTDYGNSSGSNSVGGGTLTLSYRGSGATSNDDDGSSGGYHLMHQSVSGPFEVYIRVDEGPNSWRGLAGLEVRADYTDSRSNKVLFGRRGDNTLGAYSRDEGGTDNYSGPNVSSDPVWLKIVRNGDEFELYYQSSTSLTPPTNWGDPWQTISGITMPDTVQVGIFNSPGNTRRDNRRYDARFRYFHVCATQGLATRCGQVEENGNGFVVLDAANYIINQAGTDSWQEVVNSDMLGSPGAGIQALPDNGTRNASPGRNPHTTYQVNFESSGTFYVWVAGLAPDADGDSVYVGLNGATATAGTVSGLPIGTVGWVQMPGTFTINAGINTIDLWMAEDGAQIYKILLTQSASYVPDPNGVSQSACTIIAEPHVPPFLEVCSDPIQMGGFEGPVLDVENVWPSSGDAGISIQVGYGGSNSSYMFLTQDPGFGIEWAQQTFVMPELAPVGILSNTTAYLHLNAGAYRWGDGDRPDEHLYFDLRRASDNQPLVQGVFLHDGADHTGDVPQVENLYPFDPEDDAWIEINQDLFATAGVNPLSVVEPGDPLVAYFYNTEGAFRTSTQFFIDNVSLEFCSVQPPPEQQAGLGQLSGRTLRDGGALPGVTVWAYADAADDGTPGPVFQTQSIQDGSYHFYNLPAGQYLVYAQITTTDGILQSSRRVQVYADQETRNVNLNVLLSAGN